MPFCSLAFSPCLCWLTAKYGQYISWENKRVVLMNLNVKTNFTLVRYWVPRLLSLQSLLCPTYQLKKEPVCLSLFCLVRCFTADSGQWDCRVPWIGYQGWKWCPSHHGGRVAVTPKSVPPPCQLRWELSLGNWEPVYGGSRWWREVDIQSKESTIIW